MEAKIWTGVGEKTPTLDGPPVRVGPPELVTAAGGAVVPVDNSVVVVDDEGALPDEVVPEVLVVETASCARNTCELAAKISANKTTDNRLISGVARVEPRLEQETRNPFVKAMRITMKFPGFMVFAPVVAPPLSMIGVSATD
jgi:hypothetical protein